MTYSLRRYQRADGISIPPYPSVVVAACLEADISGNESDSSSKRNRSVKQSQWAHLRRLAGEQDHVVGIGRHALALARLPRRRHLRRRVGAPHGVPRLSLYT